MDPIIVVESFRFRYPRQGVDTICGISFLPVVVLSAAGNIRSTVGDTVVISKIRRQPARHLNQPPALETAQFPLILWNMWFTFGGLQ